MNRLILDADGVEKRRDAFVDALEVEGVENVDVLLDEALENDEEGEVVHIPSGHSKEAWATMGAAYALSVVLDAGIDTRFKSLSEDEEDDA